jgi:O-antigen ligase
MYFLLVLPILFSGPLQAIIFNKRVATGTIGLVIIVISSAYLLIYKGVPSRPILLPAILCYIIIWFINILYNIDDVGNTDNYRRYITEIFLVLPYYLICLRIGYNYGIKALRTLFIGILLSEALISVLSLGFSGTAKGLYAIALSAGDSARDYTQLYLDQGKPFLALSAGSFDHPNLLGSLLALLYPQLLAVSLHKINIKMLLAHLVILVACVLTYSRGTWVAICASLIIILIATKKLRILFISSLIVVIVISAFGLYPSLKSRLLWEKTINERAYLLEQGINYVKERIFFGYGLAYYSSNDSARAIIVNPHNDIITRLVGGGVIGFAAFLVPFLAILMYLTKRKSGLIKAESYVQLATTIAFILAMSFNPIQNLFPLFIGTFAIFECQYTRV